MIGLAELRKREHENKRRGNWGEKGRLPFCLFFPAPPTFRMPFTFTSSPQSESLEQAILEADNVLRDLKVSEVLFQVIAVKYFTEFLP